MASKRPVKPGTIGITIEVIEYDGDTRTYRKVKSLNFAPTSTAAAWTQGKLAVARRRTSLGPTSDGER